MAEDERTTHGEPFVDMRRRALIAAGLFLFVHPIYTFLQAFSLVAIPLPPVIDAGVLATSFFFNAALDVAAVIYLVALALSPRTARPRRLLHVATTGFGVALMAVWGVQLHFGGSMSSHMLAVALGTIVVLAWFVPPRTTIALAVATALILVAIVLLEARGTLRYSPLLRIGDEAEALFLDWRVVAMNVAIFIATFVLVVWILLRMRTTLRDGRAALAETNERLEREAAERERAQQTLKRAVEELSARNEQLSGFVRGTAHDMRSPLTAVGGYASMLKEDLGARGDTRSREHLDRVEDGVRHMARLLDDLTRLVTADRRDVPLVRCDAALVARRVESFLAAEIRDSGARLEIGPLPAVMADESRLTQVMQNLVGNALKFRSDAPPVVRVSAEPQGRMWRFSVRDNGIGFDPAQRDRLFKPFERLAPERYSGNGIGLSVSRMLVAGMGGAIGARPEPDGGSTFWFTLRAADGGEAR
ncbi:MAG: hypothetical protein FJ087_06600 [Deltaproteobacteria bacterium]|nr:hypothetical protein [Deltaproteobacteria bacterium]